MSGWGVSILVDSFRLQHREGMESQGSVFNAAAKEAVGGLLDEALPSVVIKGDGASRPLSREEYL